VRRGEPIGHGIGQLVGGLGLFDFSPPINVEPAEPRSGGGHHPPLLHVANEGRVNNGKAAKTNPNVTDSIFMNLFVPVTRMG
jgi:hypothetical protein